MDDQARGGPRPGGDDEPAGLSPVRAFLLLGAVLAAIFAGFLATREETPATETVAPARSPDYSLTDAEAIADLRELQRLLASAYRQRDPTLVKVFAAAGSPFARRVQGEIRTLIRDGVFDKTRIRSLSEHVLVNSPTRIEVEQVVIERPRFEDAETGRDLTVRRGTQRQTVVWTLRLVRTKWLIEDALITKAEAVESKDA